MKKQSANNDSYAPVPADIDKWLDAPAVRKAYEEREPAYAVLDACLAARKRVGMTQADVAQAMGTSRPAVARIESARPAHAPSVTTLQRYAAAVGCRLRIELEPLPQASHTRQSPAPV
ncbi:MAG: helix-turn-helix transcriptional regulator [Lentisphaeria bacterium]